MLIVNGSSYPIIMLGFVGTGKLLFEMIDKSEEEATEIFSNANTIFFINRDGVKADYSKMKFDGFMDGAAQGNVRVILSE